MQISKAEKKILGPPPFPNPGYAPAMSLEFYGTMYTQIISSVKWRKAKRRAVLYTDGLFLKVNTEVDEPMFALPVLHKIN